MKIAIDIDDVIVESGRALIKYISKQLKSDLGYHDMDNYSLGTIYDIEQDKVVRLIDAFHDTDDFKKLEPVEGSVKYIPKLAESHSLVLLSARSEHLTDITNTWVSEFIGDYFDEILLTGLYRKHNDEKVTKADVCIEKKADLLIEDAAHHAVGTANAGITTILYERPWNLMQKDLDNLYKVKTWDEVYETIERFTEEN